MEVSIMEVINTGELVKKSDLKENTQGKAKIENVNELRKKLYLLTVSLLSVTISFWQMPKYTTLLDTE
jgi:hypothetical protein